MNDTRQEILRIATNHFATMDYSTVNLEEIAREAHVTRAPLYYYFRNKEGLYRAVVEASLQESREAMDKLLSADENVFEIIRKEYAYCIHGLGRYRRIWYPGPGAPDCQDQVHEFSQWLIGRKYELFSAAKARGELAPDADLSELVTLIYVFYYGTLDTLEITQTHVGLNRDRLDNSEDWFMNIVRDRYGNREKQ